MTAELDVTCVVVFK